jgi:hypothetical protein
MSPALIAALTASAVAVIGAVFTGLAQYRHANSPDAHNPQNGTKQ